MSNQRNITARHKMLWQWDICNLLQLYFTHLTHSDFGYKKVICVESICSNTNMVLVFPYTVRSLSFLLTFDLDRTEPAIFMFLLLHAPNSRLSWPGTFQWTPHAQESYDRKIHGRESFTLKSRGYLAFFIYLPCVCKLCFFPQAIRGLWRDHCWADLVAVIGEAWLFGWRGPPLQSNMQKINLSMSF